MVIDDRRPSIPLVTKYVTDISLLVHSFPSGFPRAAAFINNTNNFTMFRRFGRVHCRLLLQLQAEITVLERKLDALDMRDNQTGKTYRLKRCSWDPDWNPEQKNLLDELREKVTEYGGPTSNS
jgi:hypothetical protein